MQIAFSTHACNDWSLEWQGVKNKKLKTVLCFTAGAGESALVVHVRYIYKKGINSGRYQSLIIWLWLWRGNVTAQQTSGSFFLQKVFFFFSYADDLTWFLVCCCALSLLLGCRGVSLGMGPIGVGCSKRQKTNTVKIMTTSKKIQIREKLQC